MKIAAPLLAYGGLVLALDATTEIADLEKRGAPKDPVCHLHMIDMECNGWKDANWPLGEPSFNVTMQRNSGKRYDEDLKATGMSLCRNVPKDPKWTHIAMDHDGCTYGRLKGDTSTTFGQFNAIIFFKEQNCAFDGGKIWEQRPFGTRENPTKMNVWCWDWPTGYRSFAMGLLADPQLDVAYGASANL